MHANFTQNDHVIPPVLGFENMMNRSPVKDVKAKKCH